MSTTKISWEIVLAGLAFIGIGIYLLNQNSSTENSSAAAWSSTPPAPAPPSDSDLPGAIVIDLEDLQSLEKLKELRNLNNLDDLKNLEFELKNLESIIKKHAQSDVVKESLDQSLKQLEAELQKMENADFRVKLQNQKLYINKDYNNVDEAQWTEINPGVFVFREQFSISDMESMDLKLGFGNLNIVGSDNQQGELTLQATGNVEDPAKFAEQLKIEKNLSSPEALFRVIRANGSNISDQINLEATLTIPRKLKVIGNTSGGHINASNLSNDQHLLTSGGHITLSSLEGKTVAETNGGHITGDQISGETAVSTGGGHIQINESTGSLAAETGGGHIEIENASGSITGKTSGGNISASVQQADGPLKFTTSAGSVSLNLPQNIAADLDISGSSVSLSDDFNFDGTENRSSISGSINGGGFSVVVNCGYGNVKINSN